MKLFFRCIAFLTATVLCRSAPGDLDTSLNGTGFVLHDVDPEGSADIAYGVCTLSDGRIVLAGYSYDSQGYPRFAVVRYDSNGALDGSFGSSGIVTTPTTSSSTGASWARSLVAQADGKIVVAGVSRESGGTPYQIAMVRYNTDGTLDTSFSSDGITNLNVGNEIVNGISEGATGIALQSDGRILVVWQYGLARFNSNGTLDSSFDGDGKIPRPSGLLDIEDVAVQSNGKILIAGSSAGEGSASADFALARYNSNGSLDTTFNTTGIVISPIGANYDGISSLALQSDGKIIAAGYTNSNSAQGLNFAVARYNTNGSLDATFSGDGKLSTDLNGTYGDKVRDVVVRADGKIFAVGQTYLGSAEAIGIARYNANGTLDTSFNETGTLSAYFGYTQAFGASVQPNGKLLVAGGTVHDGSYKFSLSRFEDSLPQQEISVEQPAGTEIADGGSVNFGGVWPGMNSTLTFTIKNYGLGNLTLIGTPKVAVSGTNAALFTVVSQPISPLASNGSATFTVQFAPTSIGVKTAAISIASDDGDENPFDIVLSGTGLNNTPTISDIVNQTINEDANTGALSFTIGDVETAAASLTVTRSSSNTVLVPTANVVLGGSGASRTVTVTPAANQFGTTTITLTVSDGTVTANDTFLLTVNSVNDVPTISNVTDRAVNEDVSTGAIALTIGDVETAATSLTVTHASSNTVLVPTANIVLGGSGASRTVTVTPVANQFGTSTITVTVSDGTATANDTFLLTVNAVNDAPTITDIVDQSISVNSLTNSLPFTVGDVETTAAALAVNGTSSNQVLVPDGSIFFGGSGTNRTVTVIPAPNQVGNTTITVTVSDGTLTGIDTFVVEVVAPEIAVEQPFNSNIADGGAKSFGSVAVGANTSLNFFIKNIGTANLTGLTITQDGSDAAMFSITSNPTSPVSGPNGNTAFTVRFAPTSAGLKTSAIHIASNDLDENPFDITLTGNGVIPLADWRQQYFGSTTNSGDGADLNDFDDDGLPNLVEYAFGFNPKRNSAGQLPQAQMVGGNFGFSFTEPDGVTGITYGAEWSATMAVEAWHAITDTGTAPQHTFSVPMGSNTGLFIRLKVTSP